MDRRKFVSTLGLGSAAALAAGCSPQDCGPAGEADSQTYRWRMVTTWPKNYPGVGTGPERFAQLVEAMSGGQMRIRVHKVQLRRLPDDVIDALKVASDEVLEALVAGNAQAEAVYESYRAFEKRAVAYHAIAEEAYYQIRTRTRDL